MTNLRCSISLLSLVHFFSAACAVLCFRFVAKIVLIAHQYLAIAEQCLHIADMFSFFPLCLPASKLGEDNELWGYRAGTADTNCAERYPLWHQKQKTELENEEMGNLGFQWPLLRVCLVISPLEAGGERFLCVNWFFCSLLGLLDWFYLTLRGFSLFLLAVLSPVPLHLLWICHAFFYSDNYFRSLKWPTWATTVWCHGSL